MDFPNNSNQSSTGSTQRGVGRAAQNLGGSRWWRIASVILLFCLTIITVAVITMLSLGGTNESKYVQSSDYQAVFLTNGQVYFGKVKAINSDFIRLENIYYLTQTSASGSSSDQSSNGNYTLVKLGCQQIHYPLDEMVINRSQVSFWENLNAKGKVVTSIAQFQKSNPNGPDCSQVSNQTQASSNSGTQASPTSTQGNSSSTTTPKAP